MHVMLANPIEFFDNAKEKLTEIGLNIHISGNFEQVLAMAKTGELEKLCILVGGYNNSKSKYNNICGQKAAEEIHTINPDIPILVWNGRENEWDEEKKQYYMPEVKNANETYLRAGDYSSEDFFRVIKEFYEERSTTLDIPVRDF